MERTDRSEAIREGKFLSLESDASLKSTEGVHNAQERPFVIPEYDPEGSIVAPRNSIDTYASGFSRTRPASSEYSEKTIRPPKKLNVLSSSQGHTRKPTIRYNMDRKFMEYPPLSPGEPPPYTSPRRLPQPPPQSQTHLRRSRFSIIPSLYQAQEHLRVSRLSVTPSLYVPGPYKETLTPAEKERFSALGPEAISPMHIVKLPDHWNVDLEPPDGGTLAWMQALAGFFVIMNAQ